MANIQRPHGKASASVASLIARLREVNDLSQSKMAEAVGTSQPNVAAWESGKRVPTIETLEKLADRFDVEIAIRPGRGVEMSERRK